MWRSSAVSMPVDVEEVPRRAGLPPLPSDIAPRARPWRRCSDPTYAAGHSRATLSRMPMASSISRSPTISGGRMRSTLSPARQAQQTLAAQFRDDIAGRHDCSGCRAAAPSRAIRRTASGNPRRAFRAGRAAAARSARPARKSRGSSITSSTALPHATASGLPPKVEPCVPGDHAGSGLLGRQTRADREAVARAPWRPP